MAIAEGFRRYTATVRLQVEVDVQDVWGESCTVAQVERQASTAAMGLLQKALIGDDRARARIRATGTVLAVVVEPEKRT